jgi:transcriptional regulator with XRE-family HTH domain
MGCALSDDYNLCRICETESTMPKTLAPEVRSQFAKRLKAMRAQGGFERARYFAKALGIEENRYTRYERAEVEPSLTLIHKMCDVLRVTPNELLGFPEHKNSLLPGFAEDPAEYLARGELAPERHVELLAWRLASEVAGVRGGPRDPFTVKGDAGRLYQLLLKDPFNTIAAIVSDEALKGLDADHKAELAQLVDAFTDAASRRG